jgi:hypothetical protein
MTTTQTTEDERTYEAIVKVHLPGYLKPTEVKMQVKAHGLPQATEAIIAAWYKATEPKDISIREIESTVSEKIMEVK